MARSDASTTVLVNLDAGAPYGTERKVQSWRGASSSVGIPRARGAQPPTSGLMRSSGYSPHEAMTTMSEVERKCSRYW
jgi:hypothetical protein